MWAANGDVTKLVALEAFSSLEFVLLHLSTTDVSVAGSDEWAYP